MEQKSLRLGYQKLGLSVHWWQIKSWIQGFPHGSVVKNSSAMQEILGQENPLEKEMATHSSNLAWEIAWSKEPGRLQRVASYTWLSDLKNSNNNKNKS